MNVERCEKKCLTIDQLTPGTSVDVMVRENPYSDYKTRSGVVSHTDTGIELCDERGHVIFKNDKAKFVYIELYGTESRLCFPAELYGSLWKCVERSE